MISVIFLALFSINQYASADPIPITLSPPTNLSAVTASETEIDLSWTAPSNISGLTITGYMIERSTDGGTTWNTISSNTYDADTTYQDTDVSAGTTYTYRVSAITILITSNPSNIASATPQSTTSQLTVNSQDSDGNALPGFYTTLRNEGGKIGSGYTPHVYTLSNGQSYTIQIDIQYEQYTFDHWKDTGSTSYSRTISISSDKTITAVYSTPPKAPTGLGTVVISSSQINLSWSAPTDNGGSAITGYKISRSLDNGSTWTPLVANTGNTVTSYSDTGLTPNATYTYRIFAINNIGTSSASNTSSATTSNPITPPQMPTGLVANAISSSQINLSWIAPVNTGNGIIIGYKIERSDDNGSTWDVIISNSNSTATSYSNTGLVPNTQYSYRVSAINSAGTGQASISASATTQNNIAHINQVKSGLIVSDSLTNETKTQQQLANSSRYWGFGGDAPAFGAQYDFFKNPQGLHVGARAKANETWAGYFAVSPNTNGTLFHSVITTPLRSLPYEYFENGMYIQTSQPFVNYITCFSATSQYGTVWAIVSTIGNATQANQFKVLYVNDSQNQPLTRDCTIITNGNNYLKAYLDGTMVYSNSTMNLQMPGPFNTYLEPQTTYPGQLLNGTYTNYYATTSEIIKITNLPSSTVRADLVSNSGNILASVPVSNGTASLDVGKYDFPLAGTIKTYDSSNALTSTSPSMTNIYGGDVYSSH